MLEARLGLAKATLLCGSWVDANADFVGRQGLVIATVCRLARCAGESFCWVESCELGSSVA